MDERTLLLHVGAVPTAGWALDRVLTGSETALASRGIAVLPSQDVQQTLRHDPGSVDADRLTELIEGALARPGVHTVATTAEAVLGDPFAVGDGLFAGSDALLAAVATVTGAVANLHRTVVLSVCPQTEFLHLYFRRMVGGLHWTPFEEWIAGVDLDNLSWTPLRRRLEAVFGADAVRVVVTGAGDDPGRPVDLRADIVTRFAALLGDDVATVLAPAPRAGASLSQQGLELGVAATPHLRDWWSRRAVRALLAEHFTDAGRPGLVMLDDTRRAALDERYRDDLATAGDAA